VSQSQPGGGDGLENRGKGWVEETVLTAQRGDRSTLEKEVEAGGTIGKDGNEAGQKKNFAEGPLTLGCESQSRWEGGRMDLDAPETIIEGGYLKIKTPLSRLKLCRQGAVLSLR